VQLCEIFQSVTGYTLPNTCVADSQTARQPVSQSVSKSVRNLFMHDTLEGLALCQSGGKKVSTERRILLVPCLNVAAVIACPETLRGVP
jgi:hypothetical protein